MTIRHTLTTTVAALAFATALSAQAQTQGFNDRTEVRFDPPAQTPRLVVQIEPTGFNDRSHVSFENVTPSQRSLGPAMVDADLSGFNDKSSS